VLAKSFKIHLTLYLLVNVFLIGVWAAIGGGYFWPMWSILASSVVTGLTGTHTVYKVV
jgi:hypothetical protein